MKVMKKKKKKKCCVLYVCCFHFIPGDEISNMDANWGSVSLDV